MADPTETTIPPSYEQAIESTRGPNVLGFQKGSFGDFGPSTVPPPGQSSSVEEELLKKFNVVNPGGGVDIVGMLAPQARQGMTPEDIINLGKQMYVPTESSSYQVQRTPGIPQDPAYIEAMRRAVQERSDIAREMSARQSGADKEAAETRAWELDQMAASRQRQMEVAADVKREIADQQNKITQARAELGSMEVDPNRFWNSKTALQRLMITFGLASEARQARRSGGYRGFSTLVNKMIDADITAQRVAIEKKKYIVSGEENTLSYFYKKLGVMEDAERETRGLLKDTLNAKLMRIKDLSSSDTVKMGADAAVAELNRQQADLEHRDKIASMEKKVISSTTQRGEKMLPLALLKGALQGGQKEPLPDKFRKELMAMDGFRAKFIEYYNRWTDLNRNPTLMGKALVDRRANVIEEMKQRLAQAYAYKVSGSQYAQKLLDQAMSMFGRAIDNNETMRDRGGKLLKDIQFDKDSMFTNLGDKYDVTRPLLQSLKEKQQEMYSFGTQYPEIIQLQKNLAGAKAGAAKK